jgi:hypothetical protein
MLLSKRLRELKKRRSFAYLKLDNLLKMWYNISVKRLKELKKEFQKISYPIS